LYVTLWRSVLLYALVIFLLRFMGKRQIGELQPSELVSMIMISNIAAIPIENSDAPLLAGVIPIVALSCLEILSAAAALKSHKLRKLLMGTPRWVIRDGIIDQKQLSDMRWSLDDLYEQLRSQGVFDVSETLCAVIETNGSLSVYQKFDFQTLTMKEAGISAAFSTAPPEIIISDSKVCRENFAFCGIDEKWFEKRLRKEKLTPKDIFLMTCDRDKNCVIIKKESVK